MVLTSQRRNCSFACKCFTKWFVFSFFALMDSLDASGCTDSFHNIGDDVQLNCSVSGQIVGTPLCRNATNFQYKNCHADKYCVDFDNATNSIILTIANATENDFIHYTCGALFSGTARVNWSCCFNLIQFSTNSSSDSSMTSLINIPTEKTEITLQEDTNTSVLTTPPSIQSSSTPSIDCVEEIEKICTKASVLYDQLTNETRKCFERLMKDNGADIFTVPGQRGHKSCIVTCYRNKSCEVTSPGSRTSEGSSTPSYKRGDQGATNVQTTSNSQGKSNNVYIVIYILCGVMIALVVLIVGLCFYLCSDKKTDQTQDNSIYSHTLGDVKLTRIELYAQNSSTSNSNHERERNENRDEKNSSDQILASEQGVATPCSETSGWEDNVAYEPCTNVTEEGDYADVNDQQLLKDEDGTKLSETEKRNRKAPTNSNSNLYECVIDKGE